MEQMRDSLGDIRAIVGRHHSQEHATLALGAREDEGSASWTAKMCEHAGSDDRSEFQLTLGGHGI